MSPKQVLITGATGFVGCRLAEVAVERGIPVVGMVRSWHKAARLARLPIRMAHGNLMDKNSLREAIKGCDVVFHCAVDSSVHGKAHRETNVQGTANLMETALEAKVKRVVFISSTAVYGFWPSQPCVTEDTPCPYTGDAYCDGKIDAEKAVLRYQRETGLAVVILRPSMVFGPYETFWAQGLIASLQQNRMVLVEGGNGICNSLYVDNLVEAVWLAAERESAVGNVFIISDAEPVKWKQMIESHASAINGSHLPLPEMSVAEIEAARARIAGRRQPSSFRAILRLLRDPGARDALRTVPAFARLGGIAKKMARGLSPDVRRLIRGAASISKGHGMDGERIGRESRPPLSKDEVRFYSCNVVFSIEKARRMLGYEAKINSADGMRRTAEWIRWMRL